MFILIAYSIKVNLIEKHKNTQETLTVFCTFFVSIIKLILSFSLPYNLVPENHFLIKSYD